ncbi:alpha/beta hydrolase [Rhodococcus sp. BP-252]|uniref:alpha/beta fold hydrolase n=1 Tax=unclassified Rhodococcus (in: high G+C Gram-positive bacteria) TaxID=192944 RepID=UPI000DF459C6|nr:MULTISPECIES: alpha/beta hydrolase [unclassified Rhodococcus (in: high G+C Gram-positive bacteria)]MBY6413094.1 alpha/beta hydrolase [Rhodococcus sp. BP-320]MBY6417743.1 alpha/beta hydrolase [Rhodococcus sp. BP-321]MBY6423893.1 alpha/beta hydrolase [Rhodococcus sp. BP-324]MBY6427836.1 alpha/beta hydrolase [Rhodococcus sp. BP-323]MBY6431835.1 alpha/beta hydrolase [Rhodococcus sp. BP-322]
MRQRTQGRSTVVADDGTALAVRESGDPNAPMTVVFVHGHCLAKESWADVQDELAATWGDDIHMVSYDHRGHGASGSADASTYTIEQLGRDLAAVVRTTVPTGRYVVVGHSMGGMTAMAYARQQLGELGDRLVGVGLVATAASGLAEDGLGAYLAHPLVSMFQSAVRHAPSVMGRSKRLSRGICAPIVRAAGCGSRRVSPRVVAVATAMLNDTSVVTMAAFLKSLHDFDESKSIAALAVVPTFVLCGSDDVMTPMRHSEAISRHLPAARLVTVEKAGHMVVLERAREVADAVATLVERAIADTRTLEIAL